MVEHRFAIEIGGVAFTITIVPSLDSKLVEGLYSGFKSTGQTEWEVRVIFDPTLHDGMPPRVHHKGDVTYFRTMSHEGWVDLGECRAEVSTPSQERIHSALVRVLSFILMQTLPRKGKGLLVHGAGILFNQNGHLFFGASGRGKSTVSRLARGKGRVLTDENALILKDKTGFRLHSTPFWGLSTPAADIQEIGRADAPLVALYALEHSNHFELERLSMGRATMALLTSEKVATERNQSASVWLAMVSKIVAEVPVYRLGFRPTQELWHFLSNQGCLVPG